MKYRRPVSYTHLTFYCDFDVFKNIYQMNLRSARRSSRSRYLVLLTMQQPEGLKEEAQPVSYTHLRADGIQLRTTSCSCQSFQ